MKEMEGKKNLKARNCVSIPEKEKKEIIELRYLSR